MTKRGMQRLAVVCAFSASLTYAVAPPPFDFAGRWGGAVTSSKGNFTLTADFVSTPNPRRFTGTETLADALGQHVTCTFTAKYRKTLKVRSTCDDGRKSTVTVRVDAAEQTLSGSFLIGRRHPAQATFVLTKNVG